MLKGADHPAPELYTYLISSALISLSVYGISQCPFSSDKPAIHVSDRPFSKVHVWNDDPYGVPVSYTHLTLPTN